MSAELKHIPVLEPVVARAIERPTYVPSHEWYGIGGWISENKQALISYYLALAGCEGSDEYSAAEADIMEYEMHPGLRNDFYWFAACQRDMP